MAVSRLGVMTSPYQRVHYACACMVCLLSITNPHTTMAFNVARALCRMQLPWYHLEAVHEKAQRRRARKRWLCPGIQNRCSADPAGPKTCFNDCSLILSKLPSSSIDLHQIQLSSLGVGG